MQEHPLDDDDGVDWHFLDRGVDRRVGAVIERPTPDSTISAMTGRVQYVPDESSQVVGVAEESLRRLPAEAVPGVPRSQEVVLVHDDRRSSGAFDRARKLARKGRLPRTINAVDCDHCRTSERNYVSGELRTSPVQAWGHEAIMPAEQRMDIGSVAYLSAADPVRQMRGASGVRGISNARLAP